MVLKLYMTHKDPQPKPLIDVDDDMMGSPVAGKQDRRPSLPSSNGDQSLEGWLRFILCKIIHFNIRIYTRSSRGKAGRGGRNLI